MNNKKRILIFSIIALLGLFTGDASAHGFTLEEYINVLVIIGGLFCFFSSLFSLSSKFSPNIETRSDKNNRWLRPSQIINSDTAYSRIIEPNVCLTSFPWIADQSGSG